MNRNQAVFLDKDGTLVQDVPYNVDPQRIRLQPGVAEGLCALQEAGYRLIVVTNQSGIARGYFSEEALHEALDHLRQCLADLGVCLDGFYYCPHHPQGAVEEYAVDCDCRKPRPALIIKAAYDHDVYLGRSWFVGDILNDVEAGRRAGCHTVLLNNGGETEWKGGPYRRPDFVTADFAEAARIILSSPAARHPE